MILQDLPSAELRARLRGSGLALRTGPVVTRIRSELDEVHQGLAQHYARHTVHDDKDFVDFHVAVDRPSGLRRWLKPQVEFRFDGNLPFTPLPGDQGFPMLEWGMNWCVYSHCHQYLILHSAVIERAGRALLMPAPSGSGKSTLCAGLVFGGGWRLMSDEMALIDPATGSVCALPRPVSLKNASIDLIRKHAPEARFGREIEETHKGRVVHVAPPVDAVERSAQLAQPAWVVIPRYEAGARAELRPLSRARAFMQLVDNAFNYHVHGRAGFDLLAKLIDRSTCHEFVYSNLHDALPIFDRLATTSP